MINKKIAILGASFVSGYGAFNTVNKDFTLKSNIIEGVTRSRLPDFPIDKYVTKNRDVVNMSPSQKMLVFSVGEALSSISLSNSDILDSMNIYISCSCGERSESVDKNVFEAYRLKKDINQELCNLRPNHLLTFLPNLFSANVSMIYGLMGESITFIGESQGSVSAVDYYFMSSQPDLHSIAVIGGVFNGDQSIFDEYMSISKERNEYESLTFGSASASLIVCNADSEYSKLKIADLIYLGAINYDSIDEVIHGNIELIIFSHAFSRSSAFYDYVLTTSIPSLNITNFLGNIFEASLQTQIFFALKYDESVNRALIIVEISENIYWSYLLERA